VDAHLIDQIRNSNDIIDVIQSYIPLKKSGNSYKCICPFHNDTNPSMQVSQSKQIFKCFSCGKAGNVFSFVQEYEKVSFIEAVKKLAQRVGIVIPASERTKVVSTKREQLLAVYKSAKDFFAENLFAHGENVLSYLKERGFQAETAKQLELGYALNSEKGLLAHLMREGYGTDLLKGSGLFTPVQGNILDIFRDRLIFPIHNNHGDVIAFGGRLLMEKSGVGKYINSPSTELYTKGKELYGLFKTKYEIGKAKSVIVCEGYFDFLRLFEAGFTNSVASLGTALTEDQIYLLLRYAEKILMLYDGDDAGKKAAIRGSLLCLSKGLDPYIATLPSKTDPDSYIVSEGAPALQKILDDAKPFISYFATSKEPEQKLPERIDLILDALRNMKDPIRKEFRIKETAQSFGISESALLQKLRQSSGTIANSAPEPEPVLGFPEERLILALGLKEKDSYIKLANELGEDYFLSKPYKNIYKYLMQKVRVDDIDNPAAILDGLENPELREGLADLLFEELRDLRFDDTLKQVRIRKIQHDMDLVNRMIEKEPHNIELNQRRTELFEELRSMTKRIFRTRLKVPE